jgi:hypothetical protein
MKRLKLFFTFFGGKWRIAQHYPQPEHDILIEPFTGSAGYSLHYADLNVRLYDADPIICGVWNYLIHVSSAEVLQLPLIFDTVDDLNVCQEARWLIGFWLNKACAQPCRRASLWMRQGIRPNSFWGAVIRGRIASQVDRIRHWAIQQKSFEQIGDQPATWFIDPPYVVSGSCYRFHEVDYGKLADWSRNRTGQVIVCEQEGAGWLPFIPFRTIKTTEGARRTAKGKEVVWIRRSG